MIKNVIFDLGGVLINTDPSEYLRKYGYDEEKFKALLGAIWSDSIWTEMDLALYDSFEDMIEVYVSRHRELENELRSFFAGNWFEVYSVFKDTLSFYNEICDRGYNVFLLTNFSKEGYDYISNKFGFFKRAEGAVVSSHIRIAKPDMRIYKHLLETYNLNPVECVFVDDSAANIKAAKELGMHGIVYNGIESLRSEFKMITETK